MVMKRKMNSKEALEKLSDIPIYKEDEHNVISDIDSCCIYKGDLCEVYGSEVDTIKKDLEILEQLEILKKYYSPFKKFLEEMFEKGYNEDLKKVKEWLEND